ncbi:hypothetical protein DAEQUDRAFT_723567 [Daedalea quercina L-15889]|uniref:Uncharacterized protein n=1 Tax=Daedalea quercina L-15889 TaxID=1314783 RepID=A0A165SGH4_9APHY|nr:hypothetical protein DAEQUDRAFT_723567 [Daedalea quercina L-15889]
MKYLGEDSCKRGAIHDARAGVVRAPRNYASNSSSSGRTLTSAEIRELVSQGVLMYRRDATGALVHDEMDAPALKYQDSATDSDSCTPGLAPSRQEAILVEPISAKTELANEPSATSATVDLGATGNAEEHANESTSPGALHEEQDDSGSASSVSIIRSISDRLVNPSHPKTVFSFCSSKSPWTCRRCAM